MRVDQPAQNAAAFPYISSSTARAIVPTSGLCRPIHGWRCARGDSYWRHRHNPVPCPTDKVAERLFLSPKTVEYRLSHIYRKLIRSNEIAALSMKLAPGESPADVKPAGSSPAACSAASRDDFRPHLSPPGLGGRGLLQRSIFGNLFDSTSGAWE